MLVCEQCGCSGELGMGWVTVVRAEADETGERWIAEYCPPCAAATLGRRSEREDLRLRVAAGRAFGGAR